MESSILKEMVLSEDAIPEQTSISKSGINDEMVLLFSRSADLTWSSEQGFPMYKVTLVPHQTID